MARQSYKCAECKEKVLATEMIEHEHNGKTLRMHKKCFAKWQEHKNLEKTIKEVFNFVRVPMEVWIGVNRLIDGGYSRNTIIETIKQKGDILHKSYYDKNWPYTYRIIENNIERVRKEITQKEKQREEIRKEIDNVQYEETTEVKFTKKKTKDDISDFL